MSLLQEHIMQNMAFFVPDKLGLPRIYCGKMYSCYLNFSRGIAIIFQWFSPDANIQFEKWADIFQIDIVGPVHMEVGDPR